MRPVRKPWWQQATALVTVSTGGVITGLNFVPGAATTMTSPASVPLHLLALEQAAQPGTFTDLAVGGDTAARATSDAQLRAAIVNVAGYYLRLAKTRTPAQMEALIWDNTSSDGTDHGESCAAFASLTLELAAQAVGQQSWVTGGETYPWPMPEWADARVDTNPASPQITSVVADAQAHDRWHPLGDGYQPQPGDWAVYDGHVEVVTSYAGGVLDTIGADSLPGLTVNAHSSGAPLAEQGVAGFVDNGNLRPAAGGSASAAPSTPAAPQPHAGQARNGTVRQRRPRPRPGRPPRFPEFRRPARRPGRARAVAAGLAAEPPPRLRRQPRRLREHDHPRCPGDGGPAWRNRRGQRARPARGGRRRRRDRRRHPGLAGPSAPRRLRGHPGGDADSRRQRHPRGTRRGAPLTPRARHVSGRAPGRPSAAPRPEPVTAPAMSAGRRYGPWHQEPAGVHQPGRAWGDRRAAAVRRARGGDDRAGHRGVGLGPAAGSPRTTTTCSASRARGPRAA